MRSEGCHLKASLLDYLLILVTAVVLQGLGTVAVAVPRSKCYALDNSSRIVDFSSWIGLPFEYEDKDSDLVIRFCKDVERRSQMGYVDFGRFDGFNGFVAGSGHVDFVQGFYNGDLLKCEDSYDKRGRTAQVNIICGNCSNGQCKGLAFVELAIPCEKPGPRVFEGFTVGFNPRSSEIVYNGMTQIGFEMSHHEFSFRTEQINVALYISAIASVSTLVRKPSFKVSPEKGLNVKLSGSGATGSPPTTLSPTVLIVDWRCEKAHSMPFEVNITIPIEGYEPVQFFLTKMCEYRQDQGGDSARGWATFGVISCMYEIPTQFLSLKFIVASALFCCGGFIYKTRVERVHGIDALPGMTILSACLETVSGAGQSYPRAEDLNGGFTNEASWEHHPAAAQGTRTTSERKYGSI
ncbi:G-protein coupled receptor [Citrus sinensis]|uniref:G-protein coupled receptor n=1 Tax=Citrus sinensis TaxID=2711 RepID=A0ACB8J108_CITSI|nr:G-protein coupled receptor [Citrus sinensis]